MERIYITKGDSRVIIARAGSDEVIHSLICFVDLRNVLAVVFVSTPSEEADVVLIPITELIRRFLRFILMNFRLFDYEK